MIYYARLVSFAVLDRGHSKARQAVSDYIAPFSCLFRFVAATATTPTTTPPPPPGSRPISPSAGTRRGAAGLGGAGGRSVRAQPGGDVLARAPVREKTRKSIPSALPRAEYYRGTECTSHTFLLALQGYCPRNRLGFVRQFMQPPSFFVP